MHDISIIFASIRVMVNNIFGKSFQSFIICENNFHCTHCLFAYHNIFFCCTLFCTLLIVCINFLDLVAIKCNLCNTRNILKRNRYLIVNRLLHCVLIHDVTEYLNSFIYWRASESNECSIWKSTTQMFCVWFCNKCSQLLFIEGVFCVFLILNFELFVKSYLSAVSFVRETDDVSSGVQFANLFTKLLNGTDKETSGLSHRKFSLQLCSICNHFCGTYG